MQAELKSLNLDPEPATLAGDPASFVTTARLLVGPEGGPGEETYELTICTPEWLAEACRKAGGIYDPRHHLVVSGAAFDERRLRRWLATRMEETQADTWSEVAERVGHFAYWDFEDYPS
jgi:hypothetical protein